MCRTIGTQRHGTLSRPHLQARPPRRRRPRPEEPGTLGRNEVRPRVETRPAREVDGPQGPPVRLRRADAREAEGQAHLWPPRAAVQDLLPEGERAEGQYGREPPPDARGPTGQC